MGPERSLGTGGRRSTWRSGERRSEQRKDQVCSDTRAISLRHRRGLDVTADMAIKDAPNDKGPLDERINMDAVDDRDPLDERMDAPDDKGPLGERVDAPDVYSPHVLFAIPRSRGRSLLGLSESDALPFRGEDVWNCFELSWLNGRGVPRRAALELRLPCETPCLVESKSLKLYLNSLSFMRFASTDALLQTIATDVGRTVGGEAPVLASLRDFTGGAVVDMPAFDSSAWACVDDEDVGEMAPEHWQAPDEAHLRSDGPVVHERLVSHLLRTLCPVTGQPDWGTLLVEYRGPTIDRAGLLKYITSLRREIGFHENAVERVALAIHRQCGSHALRVTGRFLRRGGIDINPVRVIAAAGAAHDGSESAAGFEATAQAQWRVPGQ